MTPIRRGLLVVIGAAVAFVAFVLTSMVVARGGTPLLVNPLVSLAPIVAILALVKGGLAVRKLKRHEATRITPPQAATVAVAAHAGAICGAIVAGYMVAQLAVALMAGDSHLMMMQAVGAALTAASGVGLAVASCIVETWCTIDDDDDDVSGAAGAQASPA
ncbi:MAG: DUF3180 family protein [Actinomycetaceae bacterium]|nr:DUF3180 family protein [Actinomycetaceae bacterium]MDU0970545.1 DUF3180 family protein [Actinomycetaceae bacterium]